MRLRPVDGSLDDAIALSPAIEPDALSVATYPRPDPAANGHWTAAGLLRDAARLSLRAGAGPFRSLGQLSVVPRPYQLVPLVMALRLNPVRLLIADDVGVGKTIEAALIVREMLDRGLVRRFAVLCPPHLCEQWESELRERFNLNVAVLQPSRMARLERDLPRRDLSVYSYYRQVVASIDYVKRNDFFVDNAPELVIVDEAHAAARPRGASGVQQQRFELLRRLAANPSRHIVLVTATPHSGIEESFRSLLGLLKPEFDTPVETDLERSKLVPHLVQRRRADIKRWLGADTAFPERDAREVTYAMSDAYTKLYTDVLNYCREAVAAPGTGGKRQQRVRYWAAIAILRCALSSPAAARAVLENRARNRGGLEGLLGDDDDPDELFAPQVLDAATDDQAADYTPNAPVDAASNADAGERRRLAVLLRAAAELDGPKNDRKVDALIGLVRGAIREGYRPIVYCRFIATANYVAEQLTKALAKEVASLHVQAVTGEIGDEQRRERRVWRVGTQPTR